MSRHNPLRKIVAADSDCVPIAELAKDLGLDRSHLRKYAIKNGFVFAAMRTTDSRDQLTLCLSRQDADKLKQLRKRQGF